MLRSILESRIGSMTDSEFREVCETSTKDIKGNCIWLGQKTTISYVIYVAGASLAMRRRMANETREEPHSGSVGYYSGLPFERETAEP